MEIVEPFATWSLIQPTLYQQFQDSTVAFWWGERSTLLTTTFQTCVLLRCILLNFDPSHLNHSLHIKAIRIHEKNFRKIRQDYYQSVLKGYTNTTLAQKISPVQMVLVTGSSFPDATRENFVLQTFVQKSGVKQLLKFPNIILVPTLTLNFKTYDAISRSIVSDIVTSVILFVDVSLNLVSLGCVTCYNVSRVYIRVSDGFVYPIYPQPIPKNLMFSVNELQRYREKLNRNIHLKVGQNTKQCLTLKLYKKNTTREEENCEILEEFFRYINCSDKTFCRYFLQYNLGITTMTPAVALNEFVSPQVIPFGQNETDFLFQVLLPKKHYYVNANVAAFFGPFTTSVWICTSVSILVISILFVKLDGTTVFKAFFRLLSILLEQFGSKLKMARFWGKVILIFWVFFGIVLRNLYSSSIYSRMAAGMGRRDFPTSMSDLLKWDNFDLIAPDSFQEECKEFLGFRGGHHNGKEASQFIANFTTNIFYKSTFLIGGLTKETLLNLSKGMTVQVRRHYEGTTKQQIDMVPINFSKTKDTNKTFAQFAVMCEQDCESHWNTAFLGQKRFDRIIPDQRPFFKSIKFWFHSLNHFATFEFPTFLGWFVQSGLHRLSTDRYRKLQNIKSIKVSKNFGMSGMSSGSLFSYVFLADNVKVGDPQTPAKIAAFVGTFTIVGCMILVALAVLVFEVLIEL
ncbi:unnamed protein product [Orchesella dallaii]|uniref:Uncharacterized protein n=1 Tax=Orchesella dallaii TaxID=48710 RepID=A0ABP1R4U9_9HEXA